MRIHTYYTFLRKLVLCFENQPFDSVIRLQSNVMSVMKKKINKKKEVGIVVIKKRECRKFSGT